MRITSKYSMCLSIIFVFYKILAGARMILLKQGSQREEEHDMSVFDLSVLGVVALLITLKLALLATAVVLAARILAGHAAAQRFELAPIAVKHAPDRVRS
jgi:lysylphosphatidylglycerol synthetase-like protein (DUF2156 family)